MENTLLASDIRFQGRLIFSGDAVINGKLQGQIESTGKLLIGKTGYLEADIGTRSITVHGHLIGSIVAEEEVTLMKEGTVQGDITSPVLTIERGATFIGHSSHPRKNAKKS